MKKTILLSVFVLCIQLSLFGIDPEIKLSDQFELSNKVDCYNIEVVGSNGKFVYILFPELILNVPIIRGYYLVATDKTTSKEKAAISLRRFNQSKEAAKSVDKMYLAKVNVTNDFVYITWVKKVKNKWQCYVNVLNSELVEIKPIKLVCEYDDFSGAEFTDLYVHCLTDSKFSNDLVICLPQISGQENKMFNKIIKVNSNIEIVKSTKAYDINGKTKIKLIDENTVFFDRIIDNDKTKKSICEVGIIKIDSDVMLKKTLSKEYEYFSIDYSIENNKMLVYGPYKKMSGDDMTQFGFFSMKLRLEDLFEEHMNYSDVKDDMVGKLSNSKKEKLNLNVISSFNEGDSAFVYFLSVSDYNSNDNSNVVVCKLGRNGKLMWIRRNLMDKCALSGTWRNNFQIINRDNRYLLCYPFKSDDEKNSSCYHIEKLKILEINSLTGESNDQIFNFNDAAVRSGEQVNVIREAIRINAEKSKQFISFYSVDKKLAGGTLTPNHIGVIELK